MSEEISGKPPGVDKALLEQTVRSNEAYAHEKDLERHHKNRIYWILFFYLFVVAVNSAIIVILVLLRAFSAVNTPDTVLIGFAVGTGGLGAGSLIFRAPIKHLFK